MDAHKMFLQNTNWESATIEWFNADWSPRDYARLTNNDGTTAILLKSPPDHSPDAMVGHMIGEWATLNTHFASLGLNVPTIMKQDLDNGFILMSDFGNETISDGNKDHYLAAVDILIQMRDHPNALNTNLIKYENTHAYKALRFFPQYTLKDANLTDAWFNTWKTIETSLPPCPRALTHIDFALQNLMWTNNTIGIIDFQAACDGPFVYDIVNLLEDIRRDVPDTIKQSCKDHYCATLSPEQVDIFNTWYPVITAQFHARILGQIQFLSQEKGRDDLLCYYAPLLKRFEKEIENPILKPIKDFL